MAVFQKFPFSFEKGSFALENWHDRVLDLRTKKLLPCWIWDILNWHCCQQYLTGLYIVTKTWSNVLKICYCNYIRSCLKFVYTNKMPIVYMPSFNNYYCTIIYIVWRIYFKSTHLNLCVHSTLSFRSLYLIWSWNFLVSVLFFLPLCSDFVLSLIYVLNCLLSRVVHSCITFCLYKNNNSCIHHNKDFVMTWSAEKICWIKRGNQNQEAER